jgi:cell wall assembly regulator SMI1
LVAAIYRVHNGIGMPAFEEHQGELCAARSYLYSLADALVAWNLLGECLRDGAFADFVVDRADHGVRADWWNPHWLPIAGDQAGNYSCLDLAPALGGTPGQVIGFWHEDSDRCIDAPDLAAFLLDHVDERDWAADIRAALAIN